MTQHTIRNIAFIIVRGAGSEAAEAVGEWHHRGRELAPWILL